ncbi:MAG: hypothetical protein J7K12_00190 [Thermoplasmata archaeon]|nr:hypothetical protein [Thermoplasmata archaeon]
MIKMKEIKIKLSWGLVLSVLAILAGIVYYIAWGIHYHVWADIGIYSITAFLVSLGILGSMASIFKSG